jgi:hypothetical protein
MHFHISICIQHSRKFCHLSDRRRTRSLHHSRSKHRTERYHTDPFRTRPSPNHPYSLRRRLPTHTTISHTRSVPIRLFFFVTDKPRGVGERAHPTCGIASPIATSTRCDYDRGRMGGSSGCTERCCERGARAFRSLRQWMDRKID